MKKTRLDRGTALSEAITRGSLEYALRALRQAFYQQFPDSNQEFLWIAEVFAEYLIVESSALADGDYWQVPYTRESDENISFAAREAWQLVELTYAIAEMRGEAIRETTGATLIGEAREDGRVRLEGVAVTAGVVNANGRRYSAAVLREAVNRLRAKNETPGNGSLVQVLGEADHPTDKGSRLPRVLETIVNWDTVDFDGQHVRVGGDIIPTSQGRDLMEIARAGVRLGISQRSYGTSTMVEEGGRRIQEVTQLEFEGFDVVDFGWKSDPEAELSAVLESKQAEEEGTKTMDWEEIVEALKGDSKVAKRVLEEMGQVSRKALAQTLGVEPDRLEREAKAMREAQQELEKRQLREDIEAEIERETEGLPYGEQNAAFVEAVRSMRIDSPKDVAGVVEAKRAEWDGLFAQLDLAKLGGGEKEGVQESAGSGSGRNTVSVGGRPQVQVKGPVYEQETGQSEATRAAHAIMESATRSNHATAWDVSQPQTPNQRIAQQLLTRFDERFAWHLRQESQRLEEASVVEDLNLPYSLSRAIIQEAVPTLVATSIFDVATTNSAPTRVYYEEFELESGAEPTVSDEAVTAAHDSWVNLSSARLKFGSVTITNSGGTTTYDEGDDYLIDYGNGKLMALSSGDITDGQSVKVDYGYLAIRKGEMQPIERGKMVLKHKALDIMADRLATQISREAIVFSRAQLGYDVVGRTIDNLARTVQEKIDHDIFYAAISAVLQVPNNSGGTWSSASNTLEELVQSIGFARTKVSNRHYRANAVIMSLTNADRISNWDGFTASGKRSDADIDAAGYVGRLKGLQLFETTEMPDDYILVVNRQLVQHRIFEPMRLFGPLPSYANTGDKLVAAEQYYIEQFSGTESPIVKKGAYVKITA